tara:strand:- start:1796 stop:2077 length:282 start_codon:yes stop_codon:yes gene_type:complete
VGRPGEVRKYTKTDKAYLKKTAKKRAERNKDRRELLKSGTKLSKKVTGSTKKKKGCKTEAGHTTDFKDGGTKKTPVKAQCVKANRGWRKGKKG